MSTCNPARVINLGPNARVGDVINQTETRRPTPRPALTVDRYGVYGFHDIASAPAHSGLRTAIRRALVTSRPIHK